MELIDRAKVKGRASRLNTVSSIVVAALLVIATANCGRSEEQSKGPEPTKVVSTDVLTVGEQSTDGGYVVTGTVKALYNATLSSKVMSRVVTVSVREGDVVKKGQPLVKLDARELEASVNIASANYNESIVGVGTARTAADMESKTSAARIAQAESQVQQSQASLASAEARRDLALAGPRTQEVAQSHIAVVQAESSLHLAKLELERTSRLVQEGALARRELDLAQNRYDLAKGQRDAAVQSENIAKEGSRREEIRSAQEAVVQARAALGQAKAAVLQARASAMQADVRRKEVEVARAQVQQTSAAVQSARVGLSYANVVAPFDGRVVQRMVDPGSMASPGVSLLAVEGGEYRLEAVVPESIMGSIALGDPATVEIDALSGRKLQGHVVEIVPEGDIATHSFVVKVSLAPDPQVKSGMFGKTRVRTTAVKRILIPTTSTWEREGLHYVFAVNSEGIARLRIVTLGESFDGKTEVLSGLNGGDRIVVGDRKDVTDGVKIEAAKS